MQIIYDGRKVQAWEFGSQQGRRHGFSTGGAACPEKGPLAEWALS